MKNKQRNVRFALILAVLVVVCGSYLFSFKPQKVAYPAKLQKTSRYVESGNIDDVSFYGDKKQYLLAKGFYFLGNRYLVGFNYNELKENGKSEKEYTGFRYYDIDNNMKEHKVDLLREAKKKFPEAYIKNYDIFHSNNQNFVWVRYYESPNSKNSYELFYDIENEEFNDNTTIDTQIPTLDVVVISYTNLGQLVMDSTGYNIGSDITRNSYKKGDKNLNIFSESPELKEKIADKNYTLYLRQGLMSDSEYFDTLLHWFAPKGQETLSGVKIDAYYSIDEQEHEIHSYAEFKQYYNGKGRELNE